MQKENKNILVVDLEATCSLDNSIMPESMEIIEIGAIWVSSDGALIEQFQSYVRPIENPRLSQFCLDLTKIAQIEIDQAKIWKDVAQEFSLFVERHKGSQSYWGSWGRYDKNQIDRECRRHNVLVPTCNMQHENLKANFAKNRKIKQVGMITALKIAGLEIVGNHHRALSDATNIVGLLPACQREN